MNIEQIAKLMNSVTGEVLGKTNIVTENLSNVVEVGTEIFNANAVDAYVKALVNHIGKVVFVNRPYVGKVPSVLMDSWEFGSVMEKISADTPQATENDTWNLQNGQTYSQDVFYKPTVSAKFFNSRVTFEVPVSITERQVRQSFSSAEQLNGFISMIYGAVEKSMTIKTDALIMRTINAMTAQTFVADAEAFGEETPNYNSESTTRCVNLLKLYNDKFKPTNALTAADAITNPEFVRFASYIMGMYADRFGSISTLFNIGGKDRFTPSDVLHFVVLSDFAQAAKTYLYSDTKHNEFVQLPKHETVPYWQGSGTNYAFADTSKIDVKVGGTAEGVNVSVGGVLGVMFDRDALGVACLDKRVTSTYNAKAEFFNNYYKFDAGYFNDTNENFVVFYVGE